MGAPHLPGEPAPAPAPAQECDGCGRWSTDGRGYGPGGWYCAACDEGRREPYRGDWRIGRAWPISRIAPRGGTRPT